MPTFTAVDITQELPELAGRHHPHFESATMGNHPIRWTFKPFTGHEPEPLLPTEHWHDDNLSPKAGTFLEAEYDAARDQWRDAKYVLDLRSAAVDAPQRWVAYAEARQTMDSLFAALDDTPDGKWRATISKLVAAQQNALQAAEVWDHTAKEIARVHEEHLHADLTPRVAYERAGIDATNWVIGFAEDYEGWDDTPLVREVTTAIQAQRQHLQTVAELAGERPSS